jgi:hypothetical protein
VPNFAPMRNFACFTNPAGLLEALDADVRKLRIR